MAGLIEDYAIIGDTETVALVDRSGSIDWWCAPRIDSRRDLRRPARRPRATVAGCIAPTGGRAPRTRRYRARHAGARDACTRRPRARVAVIDFMSPRSDNPTIFRVVEGRRGTVHMQMELIARFDYGSIVPWVTETGDGLTMIAGEDGLQLHSPVLIEGQRPDQRGRVRRHRGRAAQLLAVLVLRPRRPAAAPRRHGRRCAAPSDGGRTWVSRCTYDGEWRDDVVRSLITLKALTYAPDRRGVRGGHHVAARVDRQRAQLGLPLLVAARLVVHPPGLAAHRLHRRGRGLVPVVAPGRGRLARRLPDHVRRAGRTPPHRDRARLAARLRGIQAGAHRQPGQRAVPARRVRRGDGRGLDRRSRAA